MTERMLEPIARIETVFPEKFGIPRQSGLMKQAMGRIVFFPKYRQPEAFRGLEGFSHLWLGESLSAWSGAWLPDARAEGQNVRVSMALSGGERAAAASARLLILEEIAPGEYRMLYSARQRAGEDALITALYGGEGLYALDGEGNVAAGPISYRVLEGGIAVGAVLEKAEWTPGSQQSVYLICREEGDALRIDEIDSYHEGMGVFAKSTLRLSDYDDITFAGWARVPGGEDRAFESWPYGTTVAVETLSLDSGWRLAFLKRPPEGERFARIEVTDLQGNLHASPLIPIPAP